MGEECIIGEDKMAFFDALIYSFVFFFLVLIARVCAFLDYFCFLNMCAVKENGDSWEINIDHINQIK